MENDKRLEPEAMEYNWGVKGSTTWMCATMPK